MAEQRACGGCTACCKTHPIVELKNPARVWCPECEIGTGCKIYDARPRGCQGFSCQWLFGGGLESERPDKVKIVVDYLELTGFGETTMVHEVAEGALKNSFAQRVLKTRMSKDLPVCFLPIIGDNTLYVSGKKGGLALFGWFGPINGVETKIVRY
jgi:hypothetical protein